MYLYSHIWKSFIRNERWRRNIFTRIAYLFFGFNLIFLYLSFGYDFSSSLAEEGGEAAGKFHAVILWYLFGDYLVRCLMQNVPSLEIMPYLRFRIRRKKLANNIILRSYLNLFNFLPLFLITPFAVMVTGPSQGTFAAFSFLAGCILFIMLNNLLAMITGMLIRINPVNWIIPAGVAAAVALLHGLTGSIPDISRALGTSITEGQPLPFIIGIGLIIATIKIIYLVLHGYLRIDQSASTLSLKAAGRSFMGRFSRLGDAGRYLSLEILMLLRNKRPRNTMLLVPFFLVYFIFMFSREDGISSPFFTLVITTMLIGLASVSYGQLIFSWESTYFDGIMARKNDFISYLRAKLYLQVILTGLTFIPLAVFIAISGKPDMILVSSLLLYNLGANSFLVMMLALLNNGRVDLNESTFMNYQGVKGSQFLLGLLFVIVPLGLYKLLELLAGDTIGKIVLAGIGLAFLLSHRWWLRNVIAVLFSTRRYKSMEGFRKLSN